MYPEVILIWMSHVPRMNESRPIYEWVIEQVSKGNTALHKCMQKWFSYEWVTSDVWMSHVPHMNVSCLSHEWVTKQDSKGNTALHWACAQKHVEVVLVLLHANASPLKHDRLGCVAVCCTVLYRVVLCCSVLQCVLQCVAVRVAVYIAVCYSGFTTHQRFSSQARLFGVCCSVLYCVAVCCSVCCSVLCSVLQWFYYTPTPLLSSTIGWGALQCAVLCCTVL